MMKCMNTKQRESKTKCNKYYIFFNVRCVRYNRSNTYVIDDEGHEHTNMYKLYLMIYIKGNHRTKLK